MEQIIQLSFSIIIITIQFVLAAIISYKAVKTKINNLWILSIFYILQGIVNINVALRTPFTGAWENDVVVAIYYGFILLSYLSAIAFIQQVFFKGIKSRKVKLSFLLVLTSLITLYILEVAVISIDPYGLIYPSITIHFFVWLDTIFAFIPNIWIGHALLRYFLKYRKKTIDPWLKMRYLIAGLSHLVWSTLGIGIIMIFYLGNRTIGPMYIATVLLIFSIGSFIAWSMPEPLKRFFNRNYNVVEPKEMSAEELTDLAMEDMSK